MPFLPYPEEPILKNPWIAAGIGLAGNVAQLGMMKAAGNPAGGADPWAVGGAGLSPDSTQGLMARYWKLFQTVGGGPGGPRTMA
jgi:hypothetical protein